MVGHCFGRAQAQELAQGQAVGAAPLEAALAVDALEVADQVHAEVAPGRQRRPAPLAGVVGRALALGEAVEPGLDQDGFQQAAEEAEKGCPISNAIRGNLEITVKATLES